METPIESGIGWIDALFDLCVRILVWLAHLFGMSYKEVNVWIFCVIWPILTLALIVMILWQWRRIRNLKKKLGET